MKKLFSLVLLSAIMLCSKTSFSQTDENDKEKKRYEHVKEREISKTYPASGNTLDVENSFGSVKVTTWDKNEIKVDIHLEASSDNAAQAEKLFSLLDVKDWQEGKTVHFKTKIGDDKNNGCNNCKTSMQINYEIHIPSGNALDIENSFGKIEIPDYNGTVSVNSKFGSLTAGTISNAKKISVEFGKATIKSIDNIEGSFKFSKVEIGSLSGSNKVGVEFCHGSRIGLSSGLNSLDLKESYSTLNLKPADNLSASYDISTSFGSVKDKSNANIKRTDTPDEYGPDADRHYEGRSGSGSAKVNIKSSFGKIIIGDATDDELKDKSKKEKTKKTASI